MKIAPYTQWHVLDINLPQGTPGNPPQMTIVEVHQRGSVIVVFATIGAFQDHLYVKGMHDEPERASSFLLLEGETDERVFVFTHALGGRKIAIREAASPHGVVPIVNWASRMGGVFDGRTDDKARLLQRATTVLDIYQEWRITETLPLWFRLERQHYHDSFLTDGLR